MADTLADLDTEVAQPPLDCWSSMVIVHLSKAPPLRAPTLPPIWTCRSYKSATYIYTGSVGRTIDTKAGSAQPETSLL